MATQKKTWERWSDEQVSALLAIYSEGFSNTTPGTSGGSIRREVVCGLPVNPKQKKMKWRQRLHLRNLPSGKYSGVNAICTQSSMGH